ncbi:hypothetical protein MMC21_002639 [Puttea exsequens]|nr:hypothetical protein [Puttea exsequens]
MDPLADIRLQKIEEIQKAFALRCYFWDEDCGMMTFRQRLNGLLLMLLAFANITATIDFIALVISTDSPQPLIDCSTPSELQSLLHLACALVINVWLGDLIISKIISYGAGRTWMAPFIAIVIIRAFFLPT